MEANNKKNTLVKKSICLIVAMLAIVFGVFVRRGFAMNFVDVQTMFVDFDAPQMMYNFTLVMTAIIVTILLFLFVEKGNVNVACTRGGYKSVNNVIVRIIEAAIGVLFVLYSVSYLIDFLSGNLHTFYDPSVLIIVKIADAIKLILSPFCALYFLCVCVMNAKKPVVCSVLSNAPSLWFAMHILVYFVDTSCYANRFGRNMMILCFGLCIAFFIRDSIPFFSEIYPNDIESGNIKIQNRCISKRIYVIFAFLCSYSCFLNISVSFDVQISSLGAFELITRMGIDTGLEKTIVVCTGIYALAKMMIVFLSSRDN